MADPALGVGVLVATIGLADSINPTTVGPATALAIQEDGARRTAAFTAGVAIVSFLGGAILVAGPGQALLASIPHPSSTLKEIGEVALGVLLLGLAVASVVGRRKIARTISGPAEPRARQPGRAGRGGAFALGAGIMVVELPTAFPYFGAVAAIVGTHDALPKQLLLVAIFNLAFVAPLLAIVALREAAGERAVERLTAVRETVARHAGVTLAAVLGAGGLVLIVLGLTR